jgi:hypothetical protein
MDLSNYGGSGTAGTFNHPNRVNYNPNYTGPPDPHGHAGHDGYNKSFTAGNELWAMIDGEVHRSGWLSSGAGYGVELIDIQGFVPSGRVGTTQVHMAKNLLVKQGEKVSRGQPIGYIGGRADIPAYINSPHNHFQVHWIPNFNRALRVNSQAYALDPRNYGALEATVSTNTQRIAGANRYETATLIADLDAVPGAVIVTRGDDFADGVTSSTVGIPVLLTPRDRLDAHTAAFIKNRRPPVVYIAGGTAAITQAVENAIRAL